MINLYGITEIIGDNGVGKSIFAISLCKKFRGMNECNTIYITNNQIKFHFFPDCVIYKKIDTFIQLKILLTNEITVMIKKYPIKLIIIDGFEDFLYIHEKPRTLYNCIFNIANSLQKLYFLQGINIVVINNYYSTRKNYWPLYDIFQNSNPYLGLPWDYQVNYRYLITKTMGEREITRIMGKGTFKSKFFIDGNGAHLIE